MAEHYRTTRAAMLSLAVALALAGTAALLGLMGTLAEAHAALYTTRYVSVTTGNDGLNKCNLIGSPCRTIQHAVDVANSGDAILVATGTYSDLHSFLAPAGYLTTSARITQVVFITKNLSIRGGYSTAFAGLPSPKKYPTTLSTPKTQKGRLIVIAGAISPAIYGLRLTKGDATGLGGAGGGTLHDAGGGVYILSATATFNDNQVYENTAEEGGGVFLYESASTLSGNTVTTNTAEHGGGVSLRSSDATLSGNTIMSNTASNSGGGVYLNYSNAMLSGNAVISNTTGGFGGGLYLDWQSAARLSGNSILSNTALYGGGGLYTNYSNARLSGNTILYNSVRDEGGGLYLGNDSRAGLNGDIVMANSASEGGGLYVGRSNPTLTNTVIADNQAARQGGALYVFAASPRLLHTTIARNAGGSGVYVVDSGGGTYSTVALTNTILVSHTLGITVAAGNAASLEATLWYSNTADWGGAGTIAVGTHNYWGDPRFDLDGYHLLTDSAAISKGVSAGVTTDVDGQPRDANPDLGADERPSRGTVYLPLIILED